VREAEVEEGRVREAGEDLGVAPHRPPLHRLGDPHRPVAAPRHEDAADVRVSKHAVEILGARPVLAREVPLSIEDVPPQDDAEPLALESARPLLHEAPEYRPGRRHDADAVSWTETGWRDQRGIPIGGGEAEGTTWRLRASTATSRSSASRAAATELRLPFVSIEKTTRSPLAAVT
jgi:hypothetical protein